MKKIVALMLIAAALLSGCGNGGTKVVIDGTDADGFSLKEEATATPAPTVSPEERDFRGMKWGMSLSEVTAAEGEGYKTVGEGVIRYKNLTVGGFPVESEYTFDSGKLAECIYYTTHSHSDTNEFIDDYNKLLDKYKKKYGEPKYSEQKWSDGAETKDESKYAAALETGIMMYRTGWEMGNTQVNLVLFKDTDSKIKIGIRYHAQDVNAKGDVVPEGDSDI